jgi:hypothetical protein
MTETANLLLQDSRGSGLLSRLGHVRRNGGLFGGESKAEEAIVCWVGPNNSLYIPVYTWLGRKG